MPNKVRDEFRKMPYSRFVLTNLGCFLPLFSRYSKAARVVVIHQHYANTSETSCFFLRYSFRIMYH